MSTSSQRAFIDRAALARRRIGILVKYLALVVACVTTLFPLVWVAMNAFRDNNQIYGNPFGLPHPVILENFPRAFAGIRLVVTLSNSLIYAAVTVAITVLLASMTAFYLTKLTKGSFLYTYFILGIMIPVQAILIPIFVTIRDLHLIDTRPGITIVYVVTNLSIAIFILTGFMRKGVPDELLEAAILDGCGPLRAFFRLVLPISVPGVVTVIMLVFLGVWNDFLFALVMLTDPLLKTLNLAVYSLRGEYISDQGLLAAGSVILVAPAILVYVLLQEQVVKGLTAGAVKG